MSIHLGMFLRKALEYVGADQIYGAVDRMYQCLGIVDDELASLNALAQPVYEVFAWNLNFTGGLCGISR